MLIDDCLNGEIVYLMPQESDVKENNPHFETLAKCQTGRRI